MIYGMECFGTSHAFGLFLAVANAQKKQSREAGCEHCIFWAGVQSFPWPHERKWHWRKVSTDCLLLLAPRAETTLLQARVTDSTISGEAETVGESQ